MNVRTEDNKITLELPHCIDLEFVELMTKEMPQWLLKPVDVFILDFTQVEELKRSSYRTLILFSQYVKKSEKKIESKNIKAHIDRQMKADGVSSAFNITEVSAMIKRGPTAIATDSDKLDVSLINPFLDATIKTLEVQARVSCTPQKPKVSSIGTKVSDFPVSIAGVITVSTAKYQGSITLAFPEHVFLKICESMFGEKMESITGEVEDAAGELLNIIYGTAKSVLNGQHGYELAPALPTVLSGERINIRQQTNDKVIVLPFDTPHGQFQIEICFQTAKAA